MVTPERLVRSVDGLLTGWHEPEASHLAMLEAIAGRRPARALLRGRPGRGLPVARVRRRPPGPAVTAATRAARPTLPTTRRAILLLKRQGPMTARDLAAELGLTRRRRPPAAGPPRGGRAASSAPGPAPTVGGAAGPSTTTTLTPAAEALFPKRYGDLTTELLGYLGGPDGEQVDALFEQRRRRRVDGRPAPDGRPLPRRAGGRADRHLRRGRLPGRRRAS